MLTHLRSFLCAALLLTLLTGRPADAQCGRQWVAGPNGIPAGYVNCMVSWDPDGSGAQPPLLVVAGSFSAAADIPASNIATWDGQTWHALGAGLNSTVYCIAVFNGELYAGGSFTGSASTPLHYIAKWTGSAWQDVAFGTDGVVYTLFPNGSELLVGGAFRHVEGTFFPFAHLARFSAGNWNGFVNAPSSTVYSVVVSGGQPLIMAEANSSGPFASSAIERYDGSTWQPVTTIDEGGPLCVSGTSVFFSGRRTQNCNDPHHYSSEFSIYRYAAGVITTSYANHFASSFVPYNGGLYAVGERIRYCYDGITDTGKTGWIGAWNGSTWNDALGTADRPDGGTLAVHAGQLYVGGSFTHLGQVQANSIALLGASTGGPWTPLVPGFNAIARCAATVNGAEYVGGDFTRAGSVPAAYAAKYTGSAWVALGAFDAPVTSLGSYSANPLQLASLIVSGMFTHSGSTAFAHILTFNPVTLAYTPLGTGLDDSARAILPFNTSFNHADLIVGGDFSFAGGVSAPHIARWNGASWISAPFGTGMNNSVLALAAFNSQVVAGGSFTTAGGISHSYIARWDGSAWQSLGSGLNGPVRALAVFNSQLIAGGDFTLSGGTAVSHIAAWNGTSWSAIGPGLDGIVYSLTVTPTDLFAGGTFTNAGSTQVRHVARWDGALWNPVGYDGANLGAGTDDAVLGLANTNGELIAAGAFARACSQSSPFVARAPVPGTPLFTQQPTAGSACAGSTATFFTSLDPGGWFVGASFAWYHDGVHLANGPSANGTTYAQTDQSTLLISAITSSAAGGYWCTATTDCGQVVSSITAQLTVGGATCCAADFNSDGVLSVQDIFDFLSAWFAGALSADFNGGGLSIQDIFDFLAAWFVGC